MNSHFVNPAYCYRGPVVDRTGGHCLASPADQLHPGVVDYQPPQLLRAHYDDIYGYAGGYGGYSVAPEKAAHQQNGSVGGYYGELDGTGHHLGRFSTSQQLPLIDTSSGLAFQSRNSAPSPMPAPIDFCRPYLPSDATSYQPTASRQTGSKNGGGHLVSPFAGNAAAEVRQIPTTQSKQPEHGTTSGSGLGRRHVESGRSDCSRSPSGSSSRSSSPGGGSVEPRHTADCRAMEAEVDSSPATSETAASGAGSSTFSAQTGSGGNRKTASCEYQQQIYPWMRRIHLANGTTSIPTTCNIASSHKSAYLGEGQSKIFRRREQVVNLEAKPIWADAEFGKGVCQGVWVRKSPSWVQRQ